ncbi:MAG: S1 family peptidase [Candidatus Latescibacterota bacterium]
MQGHEWAVALTEVKKHVYMIETPRANGTGFLLSPDIRGHFMVIATAFHTLSQAHRWREPIKLTHVSTGKDIYLEYNQRFVFEDARKDIALIVIYKERIEHPAQKLLSIPDDRVLREGVQIGWCGFPCVAPRILCFFTGYVSAWLPDEEAYLVDGVAINGVSGGPVFRLIDDEKPSLIGLVTEYRPNLSNGSPLPGVSLVRAISSISPLTRLLHEAEEAGQIEPQPVLMT